MRQQLGSHERVRDNAGQYVRCTKDDVQVTTNRTEGFWAGFERRLHGTHHAVTRKHLHRYLSEVECKYNNRKLTDGERTVNLIQASENWRLTYAEESPAHVTRRVLYMALTTTYPPLDATTTPATNRLRGSRARC